VGSNRFPTNFFPTTKKFHFISGFFRTRFICLYSFWLLSWRSLGSPHVVSQKGFFKISHFLFFVFTIYQSNRGTLFHFRCIRHIQYDTKHHTNIFLARLNVVAKHQNEGIFSLSKPRALNRSTCPKAARGRITDAPPGALGVGAEVQMETHPHHKPQTHNRFLRSRSISILRSPFFRVHHRLKNQECK